MNRLFPFKQVITSLVCGSLVAVAVSADAQQVTRNQFDNTVETVTFDAATAPLMDDVQGVLNQYLELGAGQELRLIFSDTQQNAIIQRYALWINGKEAEHGSVAVVIAGGNVSFINANIYKSAQQATTAVLTEQQAFEIALNTIGADEYAWENVTENKLTKNNPDFMKPEATLVWVEDFRKEALDKQLRLAYRFNMFARKPISRDWLYIDAVTGDVLLKDPIIKHVAGTGTSTYNGVVNFEVANVAPGTYEMVDSTRGVLTYDIGGGTNFGFATVVTNNTPNFPKSVAVDAHWGASEVYDYWKNEHNRLSFDGFNTELESVVNYDVSYNNAFWTGSFMVYGNGSGMFNSGFEPLTSLDVCAHEIGHGVCEYTSDLVYNRESGAMNEGFSDIWAAVVEQYAAPDKQMWSIGEEIRTGALRSMSNPNLYKDPDTHSGLHWVTVVGCSPNNGNDQCGVHTNSGVLNHWFYLLSEGGKGQNDLGDNFEVFGLGTKKAAQIAYATEQILTSTATYANCRNASIGYAISTFGACSREVEAVTRAWYAVGVGSTFVPCSPQIGFEIKDTVVNKTIVAVTCPSSKTISIPMRVVGGAPFGGNATVAVMGTGNVVDGGDYAIVNSPLTFNAGSTASQNVQVNIFDNGDVTKDKVLKLYFAITQNGSNASTSYTYDTCYIKIVGGQAIPDTGAVLQSQVNVGNLKSKAVTPFFSRNRASRSVFIITSEELTAAGVRPNEPITAIEFNVTEKNSTQAFSNFNVKIDPTPLKNLNSGNPAPTTSFFSGSVTTQTGWNTLTLSSNLVWNGTDNLAIETCFTNVIAGTNNDYLLASGTNDFAMGVSYTNSGTNGCNLSFSSGNYFYGISKPVVRMVQSTGVMEAEKTVAAGRVWDVSAGQSVYFRSALFDKLIARVANPSAKLGCVNATVSQQGNGFTALGAPFAAANRTLKEFNLSATQNTASAVYDMTLYYDTSELSGANLANVRLVATSAAQDSLMDTTNTRVVVPTQVQVNGYYMFTAAVRGVHTKYFLIDDNIILPEPESVGNVAGNSGNIRVVNNPFRDRIYVDYNLAQNAKVQVRLFDITGKQIYKAEHNLDAQQHRFEVNLSDKLLMPGNYILQVMTGNEVMTHKMVKQ